MKTVMLHRAGQRPERREVDDKFGQHGPANIYGTYFIRDPRLEDSETEHYSVFPMQIESPRPVGIKRLRRR